MPETVQKKIKMKLSKIPLGTDEMRDIAASKDMKLTGLSKDTFFLGEVLVNDRIYGLLGIEKEYWAEESDDPKLDILDRISIRLFDRKGKKTGAIEERVLKELAQSAVSGDLPVFTVTLKGVPYIIDIEKEASKLVFPLLVDKSKGYFEIFQISKKSLAIGADFTVTRKLGNEKIAFINSKRGGAVEIEIYDDELADNLAFVNTMALFAGTIKYHEGIGDKIKNAIKALSEGTLVLKPSKKELQLMKDPRSPKRSKKEEKEEKKKKSRKKRRKRQIRGRDEEEDDEEEAPRRKKVLKKSKRPKTLEKYKALRLEDPVDDASGVTKKVAELLTDVGIRNIEDLLHVDAEELAETLNVDTITTAKIKKWQAASRKRVKATWEEDETGKDEDYDFLDYDE